MQTSHDWFEFFFISDWLKKRHKIFQPITERRKAKPKQNATYFPHSIENHSILTFHLYVPGSFILGAGMCILCRGLVCKINIHDKISKLVLFYFVAGLLFLEICNNISQNNNYAKVDVNGFRYF